MFWGIAGIYLAVAAVFYLRLASTATADGAAPKLVRHPNWHRAKRLTKSFLRRVRPSLPKH